MKKQTNPTYRQLPLIVHRAIQIFFQRQNIKNKTVRTILGQTGSLLLFSSRVCLSLTVLIRTVRVFENCVQNSIYNTHGIPYHTVLPIVLQSTQDYYAQVMFGKILLRTVRYFKKRVQVSTNNTHRLPYHAVRYIVLLQIVLYTVIIF